MLTASEVTFERHYEPVFRPVSLDVAAGDLLLVTGDNGSGKTTLLRLLTGLLRPAAGSVRRTVDCSWIGHQLAVKDDLTVRENLEFSRRFLGGSDADAALSALGLAGAADQEARTLSAGQRKRCALARLLLSPAPLWLLDEPYSSLDAQGIQRFDTLLAAHLARGGACVMASHGRLRPEGPPFAELTVQGLGRRP